MGKSKGSDDAPYNLYFLSMHLGYCHGPVDSIEEVTIKEKVAWSRAESGNNYTIDKPDLFGGTDKEGGVSGHMYPLYGAENQTSPQALADRVGLSNQDMPGYRDLATVFFCGPRRGKGFMIGANYPTVPPIWVRFRRQPKGITAPPILNPSYDRIDANPAAIIYEAMTNAVWGMGGSEAQIDIDSFERAGATLFEEGFGLSLAWTKQSKIETFISEIIDHIHAVLYFDPRTGKATLKLLRDDYDLSTARTITPDNAKLSSFRRKMWGETTNEIIITWTNPETEGEETITYQDMANIAMQGQVVSENRNYYGIRSGILASEIGARDIISASAPLASAKALLERSKWDIVPGEVILLDWPRYDIFALPMRVMTVDYGKPDDAEITVELLEDIFGMPHAEYLVPPTSEWEPPQETDPSDVSIDPKVTAIPYPLLGTYANLANAGDDDYPHIIVAALVPPADTIDDLTGFRISGENTLPNGTQSWASHGDKHLTTLVRLSNNLAREATTIIKFPEDIEPPRIGDLILIGNGKQRVKTRNVYLDDGKLYAESYTEYAESQEELCMFDEMVGQDELGNQLWRIWRGLFDTVPQAWPAGSPLWIIRAGKNVVDPYPRLAYTEERSLFQVRTALGMESIEDGDILVHEHPPRPYLPFRPANVQVDGSRYDPNVTQVTNYEPRKTTIDISWSNRNRLMEDSVYRRWDEGNVEPEPGQTTELEVVVGEETRWFTGLTGTSASIDVWTTARDEGIKITAYSRRDGLRSLQGYTVEIQLYRKGFGSDYGYFYGGWPEDVSFGELGTLKTRFDDGSELTLIENPVGG